MEGLENIHNQQLTRIGKLDQTVKNHDDLARAFIAAFKQADQMTREVNKSDNKKREEDQKKRGRNLGKEDYENKSEIDEILEEIDKRLEKMLEIAKKYDT